MHGVTMKILDNNVQLRRKYSWLY